LCFRLRGSKNCIKRAKAIRIAQLLIKSHFGEVKGGVTGKEKEEREGKGAGCTAVGKI